MSYWGYTDCNKIEDLRLDCNYYHPQYIEMINLLNQFTTKDLEEISNKILDHSFLSIRTEDYVENGIPFIRVTNLNDILIDNKNLVYITYEAHMNEGKTIFNSGDVLFSKTGKVAASIVPKSIVECNISQDVMGVKLKNGIDKYYVTAFFNSKYGVLSQERNQTGQVQMHLTLGYLKKLKVPIPKREIQNYIGDKIRKAEELHEEAKHLKKQAFDKLNKSLFLEELEISLKEINSKFNWIDCNLEDRLDAEYYKREYTLINEHLERYAIKVQPLRELVREKIVSGSTPSDLEKRIIQGRHYFIKANKLDGYSISSNLDLIDDEGERLLRSSIVNCGDILLSIAGSIGISSVVPKSISQACINQALVRIRPKEKEINYYLCFVLNHFSIHFSNRQANGAVQKNLNRDEVGKILIPRIDIETEKIINCAIEKFVMLIGDSNQLINEAKRDVEDLIEGKFEHSKITETV